MMEMQKILEVYPDMKLLAGEDGIDRNVSTVSVMDAPDIYKWMKGGEFLITSGYIIKQNPEDLRKLIIELDNANAAGLGIKLNRFLSELPEDIIQLANELDFPIIYIPINYAWTDIIDSILTKVLNQKTEQLLLSESIHKSFTDLVIKGKGTQDIVDALAGILNKSVIVYDLFFDHMHIATRSKVENSLILKGFSNDILKKYENYPLSVENRLYGHLVILEEKKECNLCEHEKAAIEHASTVLKLDIQRRISNYRVEQQYYDEFVHDLLINNIKTIEEVTNRAKLYGHELERGLLCVMVDIDDFKEMFMDSEVNADFLNNERDQIFQVTKQIMNQNFTNQILYTSFSDSLVILIEPMDELINSFLEDIKKICDQIRQKIKKNSPFTVTIGIGKYKESLMNIHTSFNEAKQTINIGRIIKEQNQTVYYDDLEGYRVLITASQTKEAISFCNNYLQELEKHDDENQTSYLNTLEILVKCDWNMKLAAKLLYIHYNTIKYRLQKIKDITEFNILDREQKFKIELFFKLRKIINI